MDLEWRTVLSINIFMRFTISHVFAQRFAVHRWWSWKLLSAVCNFSGISLVAWCVYGSGAPYESISARSFVGSWDKPRVIRFVSDSEKVKACWMALIGKCKKTRSLVLLVNYMIYLIWLFSDRNNNLIKFRKSLRWFITLLMYGCNWNNEFYWLNISSFFKYENESFQIYKSAELSVWTLRDGRCNSIWQAFTFEVWNCTAALGNIRSNQRRRNKLKWNYKDIQGERNGCRSVGGMNVGRIDINCVAKWRIYYILWLNSMQKQMAIDM